MCIKKTPYTDNKIATQISPPKRHRLRISDFKKFTVLQQADSVINKLIPGDTVLYAGNITAKAGHALNDKNHAIWLQKINQIAHAVLWTKKIVLLVNTVPKKSYGYSLSRPDSGLYFFNCSYAVNNQNNAKTTLFIDSGWLHDLLHGKYHATVKLMLSP